MCTVQNYISLERPAFGVFPFYSFRDDVFMFLRLEMARCHNWSLFPYTWKWRLSTGTAIFFFFNVFKRLQLDDHALKTSKGLKKVSGVKVSLYSTIRRWQFKIKTEKRGNKSNYPNGHPKSVLNESSVTAVAKLWTKAHTPVNEKEVQGFFFHLEQFRELSTESFTFGSWFAKWVPHKLTDE